MLASHPPGAACRSPDSNPRCATSPGGCSLGDETQTAVTERQLVAETTQFLHGRGFEYRGRRQGCCSRIRGVLPRQDVGLQRRGYDRCTARRLYAFTHRTFLEYFAAAQLAYDSDTPEQLARTIAPRAARSEWEIVGELAVQIKDGTSSAGAGASTPTCSANVDAARLTAAAALCSSWPEPCDPSTRHRKEPGR